MCYLVNLFCNSVICLLSSFYILIYSLGFYSSPSFIFIRNHSLHLYLDGLSTYLVESINWGSGPILATFQESTSKRHFPKRPLPKGILPSCHFPNVQFSKRKLPKSVLAAVLGS